MMKVYGVFYSFYAEGVEQEELQEPLYATREAAEKHNTMTREQLVWSGITAIRIEELEVAS